MGISSKLIVLNVSEPSKFVCEVCRQTLDSAWVLLQHAQVEHGMKIYKSSGNAGCDSTIQYSSPRPHPAHSRPPPATPDLSSRSPRVDQQTSQSSSGGPVSIIQPFANPFSHFRLPLDGPLPPSSFNRPPDLQSPSSFNRPPDLHFSMDFLDHYRIRPPTLMGSVGLAIPPNLDSGFPHAAFDRTRPTSALESVYSQRLKQLACNTLPPGLISPLHTSTLTTPGTTTKQFTCRDTTETGRDHVTICKANLFDLDDKHDQDVLPLNPPARASQTQKNCPLSISQSSPTPLTPCKLKSCEFCGKMFRFQSNLIVHRRSHTGEKPFKCPYCPHACTQQSKLKRHLKTHSLPSVGTVNTTPSNASSDGSARSPIGSPDSTVNKLNDTCSVEDNEEDNGFEEEETVQDNLDAEMTDGDYESDAELDSTGDDGKLVDSTDHLHKSGICETELSPPNECNTVSSLVSEVMKNSGLNCIQPYNEAFQAALAEKFDRERCHLSGSKDDSDEADMPFGSGPFLGKTDLLGTAMKQEPNDGTGIDAGSMPGLVKRPGFARWPVGDNQTGNLCTFFPGFPPPFSIRAAELNLDNHHVFSADISAPIDSSLKLSVSQHKSASLLIGGSNGTNTINRKDGSHRKDTCEYCGKVFRNCSNLTVHRRSHTGEKPYKCSLCNYACAQSSKLTRHMKTHGRIGKDVFKCKFCNMPFSVPSTLEKHMRKCVESRNARILAGQVSAQVADPEIGTEVRFLDEDHSESNHSSTIGRLSSPLLSGGGEDNADKGITSPCGETRLIKLAHNMNVKSGSVLNGKHDDGSSAGLVPTAKSVDVGLSLSAGPSPQLISRSFDNVQLGLSFCAGKSFGVNFSTYKESLALPVLANDNPADLFSPTMCSARSHHGQCQMDLSFASDHHSPIALTVDKVAAEVTMDTR